MSAFVDHLQGLCELHMGQKKEHLLTPLRHAIRAHLAKRDLPKQRDDGYMQSWIPSLAMRRPSLFLENMGDQTPLTSDPKIQRKLMDAAIPEATQNIVMINGAPSCLPDLPEGCYVGNVHNAPQALQQRALAMLEARLTSMDVPTLLMLLASRDVLILHVPEGVHVREVLQSASLLMSQKHDVLAAYTWCILVDTHAVVSVTHHQELGEPDSLSGLVLCTDVQAGARLSVEHTARVDASCGYVFHGSHHVHGGGELQVRHGLCAQGNIAHSEEALVAGKFDVGAAHIVAGKGHVETRSTTTHTAQNSKSTFRTRSIVDDHGVSLQVLGVHIPPHMPGSVAMQEIKGLKLSQTTSVLALPKLDIETDDVVCSHGVAVGNPSPEIRQYLEARGLSDPHILQVITEGFLADVFPNSISSPFDQAYHRTLLHKRP